MTDAGLSSLLPTSSAGGPVVDTVHVCARHTTMLGERTCSTCSAALCTACARSQHHRQCPSCRTDDGHFPHVVDVSWRAHLLTDAVLQAVRSIPSRAPAVLAVFAISLLVPLSAYLADGAADGVRDWSDGVAFGFAFACAAFLLGVFVQPFIVAPLLRRTSLGLVLLGGVVGCAVAFLPIAGWCIAALVAQETLHLGDDAFANVAGFGGLALSAFTVPAGLMLQARVVFRQSLTLRGLFGTAIAHGCVVGMSCFVLSFAWLPMAVVIGVGAVVSPVVAGVVGVVCGVLLWLGVLLGMGSFAAGSARYADDLQRLR